MGGNGWSLSAQKVLYSFLNFNPIKAVWYESNIQYKVGRGWGGGCVSAYFFKLIFTAPT